MTNANQENTMKTASVTNLVKLTDYVADSVISRTDLPPKEWTDGRWIS